MADIKAIAEELVNLTVKEVKELADVLKEEYGIEPAAAAVAVAAGPAAAGAAAAEEKTSFDVILKGVPDQTKKLGVVKAVKDMASLGLKESKELVAEWNRLAREENEDALIESFASHVYSEAFYNAYKQPIVDSLKGITKEEFRRLAILTGEMAGFDVYDSLDQIKCPVLVICGSDDAVLGAKPSIEMAAKLACTVKVFEGFGHAVYDETEEYKLLAKDFLLSV